MQMRQRDVAALDAKYTKELADAKAENDALRDDDDRAGRQWCTSKQSVSQCVKPPPPPAWIMQPPPTGRHRWTGLFHPQGKQSLCRKQLEGTQKYINEQYEWGLLAIDGQLQLLWAIHAFHQPWEALNA